MVEIFNHDPDWPQLYEIEAGKIKQALGKNFISTHHVGSTSVPDLAAKNKIDIIAEVNSLFFSYERLENLGYIYRGGFSILLRKSFTYRSDNLNINLHIFEKDDPEIAMNLLFRDYLRENETPKKSYENLKRDLIKKDSSHVKTGGAIYMGYTLGKNDFIQNILKKTGFNGLRTHVATHDSDWESVKNFRTKYFFGPYGIEDPYIWTFDHKDHVHLVLYQGVKIIGYAHIQLWEDKRAALRIIVIGEDKRGLGFARSFLAKIEKWLKILEYKSVHTESSLRALSFYLKNNYIEMPFNDPDRYESDPQDIAVGKILI